MKLKELDHLAVRFYSEPDFMPSRQEFAYLLELSRKALLAWQALTGIDSMDRDDVIEVLIQQGHIKRAVSNPHRPDGT